jgi:hypothetical protein
VLAEKKGEKGSFLVIDGKQRLLSIKKFTTNDGVEPPFALTGLKLRKDLNGVTYSELKSRSADVRAFENQPIRTVIIRNWQKEDVLYLIFHRLNSESLPLSAQELRQALHPGPFLTFADKYSFDSPGLRRTLGRSQPDFRMRDVELLVRLFAFKNFNTEYRGNLKAFLDSTCEQLNDAWDPDFADIKNQAIEFEVGISLSFAIFGRPFRKWDGKNFETRFNRAIFDVMVYYFSLASVRALINDQNRVAIVSRFKSLCETDTSFVRAIETTTKSITATSDRFSRWADALSEVLGETVEPLKIGA